MHISIDIIIIVLIFIVLDFITGIINGACHKNVDSSKMREGLYHKLGYIFAIILGIAIEYAMNFLDLGFTIPIVNAICIFIVMTEVVSILENIISINPKLNNNSFLKIFSKDKEDSNDAQGY